MGVRAGQGYGVPKSKCQVCPNCGKRGVKQWKATAHGLLRDCQYCQSSWGQAGWEQAKAQAVCLPSQSAKRSKRI